MHVFITGHTGFKGAWMAMLLRERGARVSGFALDPLPGGVFEAARVADLMEHDVRADIRDQGALAEAMAVAQPDVVVHMAAQPLVRESYRDPRTTFDVNVMGTLAALEAVHATRSVLAHVVVTTDKVYLNTDREAGYREDEPLGAADPYSTSKAMADLMAQSWIKSMSPIPTAIARAGNVIGGGDVSADRLLPDLLKSFARGEPAQLRNPRAVRPWQHVLDCVSGYLALADALVAGNGQGQWNFGPGRESFVTVGEVADLVAAKWGSGACWERDVGENPPEAKLLALDAQRARTQLGWANRLTYAKSLEWTVEWHRLKLAGEDVAAASREQIEAFEALG